MGLIEERWLLTENPAESLAALHSAQREALAYVALAEAALKAESAGVGAVDALCLVLQVFGVDMDIELQRPSMADIEKRRAAVFNMVQDTRKQVRFAKAMDEHAA